MNLQDIAATRMACQQISVQRYTGIQQLVEWMGALQAQDYTMAKWAIASRVANVCEIDIETAIADAQIIRTHVLRPTWHFVSASDIYWMLALSAPQIKAVSRSRDAGLGLTEDVFARANALFEEILDGGQQLTRGAIAVRFAQQRLQTDDNRLYHYLMRAEIDGIIFSRHSGTDKQTYSLLRESIPQGRVYSREESAAMLAKRYIDSHGPASVYDFSWWSGLSVSDSKQAIRDISAHIASETICGTTYYFSPDSAKQGSPNNEVYLLPSFDEYLISYKDRTAAIALHHQLHAFTSNGIFKPIIVSGNQVVGTWRQSAKKDRTLIDTSLFTQHETVPLDKIMPAATRYGLYMQKQVELR